jgi:hypothetical protein
MPLQAAEGPQRASGAVPADGPGTPPVGCASRGRPGSAPGVVVYRTAGRVPVFRDMSGSRPGFPVPLAGPSTRVTVVRMPETTGRRRASQRGYPPKPRTVARLWITRASVAQLGALEGAETDGPDRGSIASGDARSVRADARRSVSGRQAATGERPWPAAQPAPRGRSPLLPALWRGRL